RASGTSAHEVRVGHKPKSCEDYRSRRALAVARAFRPAHRMRGMSAFGPKRTCVAAVHESAFGPKRTSCLHREFGLIAIYMIDYGSSLRQDHLECSLRWGVVWDFGTLSLRLT